MALLTRLATSFKSVSVTLPKMFGGQALIYIFLLSFNRLWLMPLCARLFCVITGMELLLFFTPAELAVFPWKFSYLLR